MKRRIICCFIALVLIIPALSGKAEAMTLSAGIYSFYAVWQPAWRGQYDNRDNGNLLLMGPVISVSFLDDWSVSRLAITSLFLKGDSSYDLPVATGSSGPFTVHRETSVERMDIDVTLSRRIEGSLRIFAGIKFYRIDEEDDGSSSIDNPAYHLGFSEGTGYQVLSPAFGIMYGHPIAGGLSVSFSTSFLAFKTKITLLEAHESFPGEVKIDDKNGDNEYTGIGNNSSINLVYYLQSIGAAISLGGRFQVIRYLPGGDSRELENDYFYGLTVSVVKVF